MKSYNIEYDLSRRSSKTVYVSQNSTFQVGIKCKYGNAYPVVELYRGDEKLEPAGAVGSYRTWQLASGEERAEEAYEAECMGVRLPLKVVTTGSTVAELPGGEAPDLSEYAKKTDLDAVDDKATQASSQALSAFTYADDNRNLIDAMSSNAFTLSGTYEDGTEFSFKAAGLTA